MRAPGISIIVLAYENAPCLESLVKDLHVVLESLTDRHEVIVVDDGSGDGTPTVVDALVRQCGVVSRRHPVNRGVGAAFSTGVQAARHDWIGYIDGDGQLAPADLPALAALLQSADAACGIRVSRADPFHRRVISSVYNLLLDRLFGLKGPDVNCGLKLFTRAFLDTVGPLDSAGPFYDAELLVKGASAGMRIAHAPVRHLPRLHGRGQGASGSSILSAIDSVTSLAMRRYWRSSPDARLLGAGLRLLCALGPRRKSSGLRPSPTGTAPESPKGVG